MKKRSRTINIFNMSALDLFASAMGAFILITIILFPYYLKFRDLSLQIQQAEARLGDCKIKNGALRSKINQEALRNKKVQAGLQGCLQKLKITFLTIVMKWETKLDDVDMYVVDPQGHEFYYRRHNRTRRHFPSTPAKLSVDTIRGPGVEIWEHPIATPGDYKVYYLLYRKVRRQTPHVRANVYSRDGVKKLRSVTLTQRRRKVLVSTINVSADGTITVR